MEDAPRQSVLAWSTTAVTVRKMNAPVWLQRAYEKINSNLQNMVTVIQKLQDERQESNHVASSTGATYHTLLKQQNVLFAQQTEDLQSARRLDYVQFDVASTQFAEETRMAIKYVSTSATDRPNAVGKGALQNQNYFAVHNTEQFEKVEMWAKMEELASGRLERIVKEEKARNKAELDSSTRDIVAWKVQAETMSATRGEVIQERRLF